MDARTSGMPARHTTKNFQIITRLAAEPRPDDGAR